MKHLAKIFTLGLSLLTLVAPAAPPTDMVAADAKWMIHVDLDQFRGSKLGAFVMKQAMDNGLEAQLAEIKKQINFDVDPSKLSSITVYGPDFDFKSSGGKPNEILLVKTTLDLETGLDAALGAMALAGTNAPFTIKKTQHDDITDFVINDTVFVALHPSKVVVVAASAEDLKKASGVLTGKSGSAGKGKAFAGFPEVKKAFFFIGMAEAFNSSKPLPLQAQILQKADGARIVLGESGENLFVNLALRAKTDEIVTEMQQIIQGLVALASLGKPDDKDLAQLVQSIKVTAEGKIVNVNVEYPVDKALEHIDEHHKDMKKGHKKHKEDSESDEKEKSDAKEKPEAKDSDAKEKPEPKN